MMMMLNKRRKHIVMLLEQAPYTADGRVRKSMALLDAGYEVSVICPRGENEPHRMHVDGVRVYQYQAWDFLPRAKGYVLEYSVALVITFCLTLWIAATRGFQVLHAHNPPDFFVLIAILYRPFGVRFVFDHHDLAPEM